MIDTSLLLVVAAQLAPIPTTTTHTVSGPGAHSLCANGIPDTNYNFAVTVPKHNPLSGTLTKIEFQRRRTNDAQAFDTFYKIEHTHTTAINPYFEAHGDRPHFAFASFDDEVPGGTNQILDTDVPPGWQYCWPTGCTGVNLPAYDGTTDYGGTSGYQGHSTGVTSDTWLTATDANVLAKFTGATGNITIYYSPRFYQNFYGSGTSGHWAANDTDCDEIIDTIKVRYTH